MANKKTPIDNVSTQNTKLIAETTTLNKELKQQNFELSLAVGVLALVCLFLLWKTISFYSRNKKYQTIVDSLQNQKENERLAFQREFSQQKRFLEGKLAALEPYYPNEQKRLGDTFERFIAIEWDKFNRSTGSHWELTDWRSDKIILESDQQLKKIYPSSNRYPDLTFTYKSNKDRKIAIECKFRSNDYPTDWIARNKMIAYTKHASIMDTYILFGIKGEANQPEKIFWYKFPKYFDYTLLNEDSPAFVNDEEKQKGIYFYKPQSIPIEKNNESKKGNPVLTQTELHTFFDSVFNQP